MRRKDAARAPRGIKNNKRAADTLLTMAVLKQNGVGGYSGRLGGQVFRQSGGETIVGPVPEKNDPRTPRQTASRARFTRATLLWQALPLDAIARWRAYGAREGRRGDLVFKGLAAKYLQVHGGSEAPQEPPTSAFLGDGIVVEASADPTPAPPQGEGIRFAANAPNTPGVLTELLLQPLAARHRAPHPEEYRTQAFVDFAGGAGDGPRAAGGVRLRGALRPCGHGAVERGRPARRGGGPLRARRVTRTVCGFRSPLGGAARAEWLVPAAP